MPDDGQSSLDAVSLRRFLDGDNAIVREHVRAVLSRPEFRKPPAAPPTDRYREQVLQRARTLAATGGPSLLYPPEFGGLGRVGAAITAFETLAHSDLSLLVKCGVQFGLFGGAVQHLGTRKHHEALPRGDRLARARRLLRDERDRARLQRPAASRPPRPTTPTPGEFVVDTPTESARKDYIGNAARDGHLAAVFCQLIVGGEARGVHAVLVPLRDEDGSPADGVRIEDCGDKLGLNGVDNGRLSFDGVRVPREHLLDRYAEVTEDGDVPQPDRERDPALLHHARHARPGADQRRRRGDQRHQGRAHDRGPPRRSRGASSARPRRTPSFRCWTSVSTSGACCLALATTYALHFAQEGVVAELDRIFGSARRGRSAEAERDRRELETRAAGLKAIATWHATETIQACREACGGAGYLAENRLGELKADTDVFTTFEGDNTILLQLVAKSLLTDYRDEFEELGPGRDRRLRRRRRPGRRWSSETGGRELLQRLTDDLVPGRERDEDLLDRDYQLGLFRWREEHVLSGAARRLRRGHRRRRRPVHGLQRLPGPRARRGAGARPTARSWSRSAAPSSGPRTTGCAPSSTASATSMR